MPQSQAALTFAQWGTPPQGPPFPSRPLSFPSRLSSKHKTLYENHSFAVYTLALLGTTISVSLSRAPLIPLRGTATRLFYSYRAASIAQGVSYVRYDRKPATLYITTIIPPGGSCPSAALAYRGGAMRSSLNVGEWVFYEVRLHRILGNYWPFSSQLRGGSKIYLPICRSLLSTPLFPQKIGCSWLNRLHCS